MASKRKNQEPERLGERKRQFIQDNLNDHRYHNSSNFVGHFGGKNDGIRPTEIENRPKKFGEERPSRELFNGVHRYRIKINELHPTETYLSDDNHGPIIGKLTFISYDDNDNFHLLCGQPGQEDSLKPNLYLLIYDGDSNGDSLAEIAELSDEYKSRPRWPRYRVFCSDFSPIISGTLLSCYDVFSDLQHLKSKQIIKLNFCHDKTNTLEIFVELVLKPEDGVTDLNDIPDDKTINCYVKRVMKYFYPYLTDQESSVNGFRYTGQQIQLLYDYIMKYHNQKSNFITNTTVNDDSGISLDNSTSTDEDSLADQPEDIPNSNDDSKSDFFDQSNDSKSDCLDQSNDSFDQMEIDEIVCKNKIDLLYESLRPTLRPYQQAAVEWMIKKENTDEYEIENPETHVLWRKLPTLDGKVIYYNEYSARFTSKMAAAPLPHGGILADEMGLGKTVEVLALILMNPKPNKFILEQPQIVENVKQDLENVVVETEVAKDNQKIAENTAKPESFTGAQPQIAENDQGDAGNTAKPERVAAAQPQIAESDQGNAGITAKPERVAAAQPQIAENDQGDAGNTAKPERVTAAQPQIAENDQGNAGKTAKPERDPSAQPQISEIDHKDVGFNAEQVVGQPKIVEGNEQYITDIAQPEKFILSPPPIREDIKEDDENAMKAEELYLGQSQIRENKEQDVKSAEKPEKLIFNKLQIMEDNGYGDENTIKQETFVLDEPHHVIENNQNDDADGVKEDKFVIQQPKIKRGRPKGDGNAAKQKFIIQQLNIKQGRPKGGENALSSCCICRRPIFGPCRRVKCSNCESPLHFQCAGTKGKIMKNYFCIACCSNKTIETHCTLIVSPESIANQWIEEVEKHVKHGALKYMLYRGVAKEGFIQPSMLAEQDIIVTTYETLRADFYHVKAEEASLRLRHKRKYPPAPSPLTSLNFWRICLDEAQMIQCSTTRTAEMAIRIQATHRWCVTGTPVQKGLEDIYGMLLFVGVFPYCIKAWWKKLLYEPLIHGNNKPLFELLTRIMWRTEKKHVLDQINLPEQTELLTKLKFSPVERHFYEKQEEVCMNNAMQEIRKWHRTETSLSNLDKNSLHKLLAPLLRLRLACCHPHVVRGGILTLQKTHLTMERLLEKLTAKAKLECIEAHRQLMCAINGLAAIDIIEKKFPDAVQKYREAMQSWAAHEDLFKTDVLQKLHTITNLADAISQDPNCPRALSDDKLHEKVEELKKEYLKKVDVKLTAAQEILEPMQNNVKKSKENVDWTNPWWINVLRHFQNSEQRTEEEIISKINIELESQKIRADSVRNKFTNIDGLMYILSSKLDSLMELRDTLLQGLETLKCEPTKEIIINTAECCLRPVEGSNAPRCIFCKVEDVFIEYENKIFAHRGVRGMQAEADENKRLGGLRAETEVDVVLKLLHTVARQNYLDSEVKDQGKLHLEFMDLLKQEFKGLRQLWFALHQRISAFDELEMSIIRLRLRYRGEKTNENYVIDPHEVRPQRLKHESDKIIAENDLRRKKGTLFYLKNLEKTQNTENGSNPEQCPICTRVLGLEWAVFSCGHCYCCDCIYELERQQTGRRPSLEKGVKITCPLCRTITMSEDVSFVMMNECANQNSDNPDINVKGSYSVKIEAVVRKILDIGQKDLDGKIIVFSTWQDVLDIISKALVENDIVFRNGSKTKQAFQTGLAEFKKLDSVKVMLLPLKSGAKGLNIIEATHVILVEPTLNPANERQAIGRVHRIGQTKPTFVHRFIVGKTVEERITHLLQMKSSDSASNEETNLSLTIADVSNLISEDH